MGPVKPQFRKQVCCVQMCKNSKITTPNKKLITVPKETKRREAWLDALHVDKQHYPSGTTNLYCCEDHFDLPNDVENWVRYSMFGGKIMMKPLVVPHIFKCQGRNTEDTIELQTRKRKAYVAEILEAAEMSTIHFCEVDGLPAIDIHEHLRTSDDDDGDIAVETVKIELQKALHEWCLKEWDSGTKITLRVLREKALSLHDEIFKNKNQDDFRASLGWVNNFMNRYGLRNFKLQSAATPLEEGCVSKDSTSTQQKSDPTRIEIKVFEDSQMDGTTVNCPTTTGNSIKSEPTEESGNSLEANDYDYQHESDLNLENEYNGNFEHENVSLQQIQKENELTKRKLMLEEHNEKMKLLKLQHENEVLRTNLLKQELENLTGRKDVG